MAHAFSLIAEATPLHSLKPAADAAGRTGAYIDGAKYHKVYGVFYVDQANAATIACNPVKADDTSGTNAADFTAAEVQAVYTNLDAATAAAFTRQSVAASYTTDAALKQKIVVFEIDPTLVGKRYFALKTGASNVANITSGLFFGVPRYQNI